MSDEDDLRTELEKESAFCTRWARRNYAYAHAIFIVSVLASFITTVLVAADVWEQILCPIPYKVITSILASVPAVMLLINNTLRFEERTKWFWRKGRMAQKYLRRLRDDNTSDRAAISIQYSEASERLEDDWPTFGGSPGQPV